MARAVPAKKKAARPARPAPDTLDTRVLNRTWLTRQLLTKRVTKPLEATLELLLGLQAQVPSNPYVALWSRLSKFEPARLSALIERARCVRGTSLRATLHVHTAHDYARVRPLLAPVFARALKTGSPYGKRLGGIPLETLSARGTALLREQPRTLRDVRAVLAAEYPGHDAQALSYAVHYSVPMVQLPPRGLWKQGGQPVCALFEAASGIALEPEGENLDSLVLRYLAAWGPASVADAQTWSGLTKLREVFERLRPTLRSYLSPSGIELFDLAHGKLVSVDGRLPVRFLPDYENALLGLADRSRFLDPKAKRYAAKDNESFGSVLVDGYVRGLWKVKEEAKRHELRVHALVRLSAAERREVEEEGQALLTFLHGVEDGVVKFVEQL
jgi:hypothetical protein